MSELSEAQKNAIEEAFQKLQAACEVRSNAQKVRQMWEVRVEVDRCPAAL